MTENRPSRVRPLTSVELLDAAVWREIGSEKPQPTAAFIEALSRLVGRWLLVRSETPEMDALTLLCKARGYIERGGAEQIRGNGELPRKNDAPEWPRNAFDDGSAIISPRRCGSHKRLPSIGGTNVHHPIGWYCFMLAMFLMWAWGAADCIHVLRHPEAKSVFRIACRWVGLLLCVAMMFDMIGIAWFLWIGGAL